MMHRLSTLVLVGALGVTLVPACSSPAGSQPAGGASAPSPSSSTLPDRDRALAHQLVEQEGGIVLDVRTPGEFERGHIDGSHLIPVQELERRMGELDALVGNQRDTPIVLVCRSGARASRAKAMLTRAGFTRVTNLGAFTSY